MSRPGKTAASIVGIALAWGGTAFLISPAASRLNAASPVAGNFVGQIALWILFASILLIIFFWEKQTLGSVWLKRFSGQSVVWGGALVVVNLFLLFPVTEWLRKSFGLPGYAAGMEQVVGLPVWLRVVAIVTAGVVEETLFRGYTITRLAQLSGSLPLAAVISVIAFAALHIPVWGAGPSIAILFSGTLMTAFFLWKRDLLAMILAHIALDGWAFLASPIFSSWWK